MSMHDWELTHSWVILKYRAEGNISEDVPDLLSIEVHSG